MTVKPEPRSAADKPNERRHSTAERCEDVWDVAPDTLRALTDAVPALIAYFDADHICRFANEHHFRWYGREPDHLIGLHMRDLLGGPTYAARRPYLDRVAAGQMVAFDAQIPHRDGRPRDAAVRYVPRMGPDGFEGIYILIFDVTTQGHRFQSVFNGTAVGFWVVDLAPALTLLKQGGATDADALVAKVAGDPTLVRQALDVTPVRDLNAKACELFGVSPSEALEHAFGRWCPGASLPAFTGTLSAYVSGAPSFEAETVMVGRDGRTLDVLLTCAFARNTAEETTVVIGTTDITARIQQEKLLAQAQAEIAHAARAATAHQLASIAHEIHQPLAAIVSNGDAAMRWLNRAEPDTFETKNAIGRIVSEGNRAAEIMERAREMAAGGKNGPSAID